MTCSKILGRKGRERSWLIQDDGGTLGRDGTFRGFEAGGLHVKTDNLSPRDQIEAYYGALQPATYLENVCVCDDGGLDFFNLELTPNGRAVIERRDIMHTSRGVTAECVDNLFIITRGSTLPAIAKLTHEQAAAFMVLGQSMESDAGDPALGGRIKNVFFHDPFVAGDRAEHANLFYDLLKTNGHINCYLLNTGWVGEGETFHNIALADTMGILDSLLRGGRRSGSSPSGPTWSSPGRSVRSTRSSCGPRSCLSAADFDRRQKALNQQRAACLDQYPGLDRRIRAVFQG